VDFVQGVANRIPPCQVSSLLSQSETGHGRQTKDHWASYNKLTCCCFETPCRDTVIIIQVPKEVLLLVNTVQGPVNKVLVYGDHAVTPSKSCFTARLKYSKTDF